MEIKPQRSALVTSHQPNSDDDECVIIVPLPPSTASATGSTPSRRRVNINSHDAKHPSIKIQGQDPEEDCYDTCPGLIGEELLMSQHDRRQAKLELRMEGLEGHVFKLTDTLEKVAHELHGDQVNYFEIAKDVGKQHKEVRERMIDQQARIEETVNALKEQDHEGWFREIRQHQEEAQKERKKLQEDLRKVRRDADINNRNQSAELRSLSEEIRRGLPVVKEERRGSRPRNDDTPPPSKRYWPARQESRERRDGEPGPRR